MFSHTHHSFLLSEFFGAILSKPRLAEPPGFQTQGTERPNDLRELRGKRWKSVTFTQEIHHLSCVFFHTEKWWKPHVFCCMIRLGNLIGKFNLEILWILRDLVEGNTWGTRSKMAPCCTRRCADRKLGGNSSESLPFCSKLSEKLPAASCYWVYFCNIPWGSHDTYMFY